MSTGGDGENGVFARNYGHAPGRRALVAFFLLSSAAWDRVCCAIRGRFVAFFLLIVFFSALVHADTGDRHSFDMNP